MTLLDFKQHIEALPENSVLKYGISEPFSWRGDYSEVAFAISTAPMAREDVLERIQLAYVGPFIGYKGGEYFFADYTDIHFKESARNYTDGRYVSEHIAQIEDSMAFKSQEHRLVCLALVPE